MSSMVAQKQHDYGPFLLAPITWSLDVASGEYRDNLSGRALSARELRGAVENVIEGARVEARLLVSEMLAGKLDADAFQGRMGALIAGLHTLASAAATGGVPGVLRDATEDLNATIRREHAYLAGFVLSIRGEIAAVLAGYAALNVLTAMQAALQQRAGSYMDAALITFERQRYILMRFLDYTEAARILTAGAEHCLGCEAQAALGYVPIDELKPLGGEECGQWCKCEVAYRKTNLKAEVQEGT